MTLRGKVNRNGWARSLQTSIIISSSNSFPSAHLLITLRRSAVGRVEWNITGYDRCAEFWLSGLLIRTSVLFSRQLATTVAFGYGKLRSEVCGDLQAVLELNNPKIQLMQTRSWMTTPLANNRFRVLQLSVGTQYERLKQ